MRIDPLMTMADRLPQAPRPYPVRSVSPMMTVTLSGSTPSASAASWAATVSVPCPRAVVPRLTLAEPSGSMRRIAESYPAQCPVVR